MTLVPHAISAELFDQLAEGDGGPDAIRSLSSVEYSRNLHLLRGVIEEADRAGKNQARFSREGYASLTTVQRADPRAAGEVIRYPAVGAWLLRTMHGLLGGTRIPSPGPSGLCALAAAAAIRARVPIEIDVQPVAGTVHLPSLGAAQVSAPMATIHISAEAAEICTPHSTVRIPDDPKQDAHGWLPLRHIQGHGFDVIVDDLDPFRMPAIDRVAARLESAEMTSWRTSIRQGWGLLDEHHPDTAEEVRTAVAVLVPLLPPPQGQASSTSPDTFGAVALSLPPDPYTCAVTLAHELQHLKLSALQGISPLLEPEDGCQYYAPWRPDPRPLSGLLQGTYAYIGVCGFWRRELNFARGTVRARAAREFALWRMGVARSIDTLSDSGKLTPVGVRFAEGMARTLSSWRNAPIPAAAQQYATREARDHLGRWRQSNGRLNAT